MKHVDVIIVGGGPAGISTAIWCKRLGINHLLIEKNDHLGGQLSNIHNEIIDYPGIKANNGNEIQKEFVNHIQALGCVKHLNTHIKAIHPGKKTVKIQQGDQFEEIHFDYLVMATGAGQRKLCVPGEKEMCRRGEVYSASVDSIAFAGKTVAVIGGGDRAFEGAILLANAGATVYLVHRSTNFKARKQYLDAALKLENIRLLTNTQVTKINGETSVNSIELINLNGVTSTLNVVAVFIRIGVKPNSDLVKDFVELTDDGLIVTNHVGLTNSSMIYAIGDIATAPLFSSIASSVGQGAVTAKHLSYLLTHQNEHA